MTNIDFLKRHNLYEAHQHFKHLSESYIPTVLPEEEIDEADDDENDNNGMGDDSQGMGMDNGGAPQGGSEMGNDPQGPSMNGGGAPQDDNGMGDDSQGMGMDNGGAPQDDNSMGDDSQGMGDEPQGMSDDGMPPADDMDEPPMGDSADAPMTNPSEGDDDTIDINGLTKVQDKLNVKQNHIGRDLSKVDSRITKLISTISSLLDRVEANNDEIESLKAEFAKRNPTQTERLNLRSLDSYPFNVRPTDYWEKKASDSNYDVYSDNDEPTTKEYVITNDDVDNPSNDIADTFFKVDDDDIQTLNKIFNL